MRPVRLALKRIALGLFTIWTVLTGIFVLAIGGKKWHLRGIVAVEIRSQQRDGAVNASAIEETEQAYLAARGLDRPLDELYVEWMTDMFTLQWGQSFEHGRDALTMVAGGTARTAAYVLPAVVVAGVVGLLVGVVTAMKRRSRGEGAVRSLSYVGLGLPNFWIGALLLVATPVAALVFEPVHLVGQGEGFPEIAIRDFPIVVDYLIPTLLVSVTLFAAIVSYARAYSMQYYSADLTKQIRAKGGGELAVARHVVRNAAVPLVSLLFAETFALIALSVFVIEAVFAIDGIGSLFYNAVWRQDLPIVLGGTMVFVALGVVGNVTQDLLTALLDPRVGTDSL